LKVRNKKLGENWGFLGFFLILEANPFFELKKGGSRCVNMGCTGKVGEIKTSKNELFKKFCLIRQTTSSIYKIIEDKK
jgi:hypothetical protein